MSANSPLTVNRDPIGACVFAENGNIRIWWSASDMETAIKWAEANKVELTLLFGSPITTAFELSLLKHRIEIVLSSPYVCTFQSLAQYVQAAKEFLRGKP